MHKVACRSHLFQCYLMVLKKWLSLTPKKQHLRIKAHLDLFTGYPALLKGNFHANLVGDLSRSLNKNVKKPQNRVFSYIFTPYFRKKAPISPI